MELGRILAGRYKIIERIGSGGMSTVYRAHELGLEREVAIKVLISALTSDKALVERFNREARTIANLQHPNIIPIYFYGTEEDFGSFLVMPLLKGGTLDQRLKQLELRPSITEVGELAEKLGNALQFAHDKGIIHRDIKFSNILFDDTGSPYITDFGIAKMVGGTNLTGTGMTVGTPQFMPPEQWRNDEITPAVDQYALGIMLYAMLTQRMPFDAPTPHALMYQHLQNEPPRASDVREDVPYDIEQALMKALAKDPKERFSSIVEFTNTIAESSRKITREYSGFFKAPIEYLNPISAAMTTPKKAMPDVPTQMAETAKNTPRDEKPPTRIVDEPVVATTGGGNTAFFAGMIGTLIVGALIIGAVYLFVINQPTDPTEVVIQSSSTPFDSQAVLTEETTPEVTETETPTATPTEAETETEKPPSPTATETAIPPTNTPDGTITALAQFATDSANQQATENAQLRLTGTALADLATNRAVQDATATESARIAIETASANQNAANTATANAATAAAQQAATNSAIAQANTEQANAVATASAESQLSARDGTATAFANIQANAQTQQANFNATRTAQASIPTNTPVSGDELEIGQSLAASVTNEESSVIYFEGRRNQVITISATSPDFDTYLELYYDGELLSFDDDSGYGTNSRISSIRLEENDFYAILLRAYDGNMTGDYRVGITQETTCPNSQESRLLVGELGRVTLIGGANRLREGASTGTDALDSIPEGVAFTVLAGPTCAGGFAWWQVDFDGTVGYTAEGDDNEYWLEVVPDSEPLLLYGAVGLSDGSELDAGAFQIEYFCTRRGYNTRNDGTNWYCSNASDVNVLTLEDADFDQICRETYHNSEAFALQNGEGSQPAFRWRCYAYP